MESPNYSQTLLVEVVEGLKLKAHSLILSILNNVKRYRSKGSLLILIKPFVHRGLQQRFKVSEEAIG